MLVLNEVSEPYLTLCIDCYLSIRNHMTKSIYVVVITMTMMPSCSYFVFVDTSISKHVDIFFDFGFRLRTSEVYHAFISILHHAFISIFIALWVVITLYISILMAILSYFTRYHEEGECWQLEFWLEKEQTLETYSAQLQKS